MFLVMDSVSVTCLSPRCLPRTTRQHFADVAKRCVPGPGNSCSMGKTEYVEVPESAFYEARVCSDADLLGTSSTCWMQTSGKG